MASRLRGNAPAVASLPKRSGNYRVEWRLGGTRTGRRQSVTLPDTELANTAKTLAESRRHTITDTDVYKAVLGLDDQPTELDLSPTFRAWVDTWLSHKADVSPDTLAEYAWLLRSPRVMDRL